MLKTKIFMGICAFSMIAATNVVSITASAAETDEDTYRLIQEYDFTSMQDYLDAFNQYGMCGLNTFPEGVSVTNGIGGMAAWKSDGSQIFNVTPSAEEVDETALYVYSSPWAGFAFKVNETMTAGKTYRVTAEVKNDKNIRIMYTKDASDTSNNGNQVYYYPINETTSEFKEYTCETALNGDANYIVISANNQNGSNIMIKNVKVEEKLPKTYTLTANVGTGEETGKAVLTDSKGAEITEAAEGSSVNVTVEPAEGYELGKIDIGDMTVAPSSAGQTTYTINNISGDVTADVYFDKKDKLTLDYSSGIKLNSEHTDGILVSGGASQGGDYGSGSTIFDAGEGKQYVLTDAVMYGRGYNGSNQTYNNRACVAVYGSNEEDGEWTYIGRMGTDKYSNTGGGNANARFVNEFTEGKYRYIKFDAENNWVSFSELKIYGSVVDAAHDSDYFGFEAAETDMNAYNKIEIELNNSEKLAADFSAGTTFSGAGQVKYAIRITDLPADKNVTNMRLYTETTEAAE